MSRAEIESMMAKESGITHKQAEMALKAFLVYVVESLKKGEKVRIPDFGIFSVSQTKERQGRNPKTGEPVQIPAMKKARFSASSKLKETLNS